MSSAARVVTLIGKPGCHLCDDARAAIESVIAELPEGSPVVTVEERDILHEPDLYDRYVEEIPVVVIDGRVHTYWRIDPARLRNALLEDQ